MEKRYKERFIMKKYKRPTAGHPPKGTNPHRFTLTLYDEELEILNHIEEKTGNSHAEIIRSSIHSSLKNNKEP